MKPADLDTQIATAVGDVARALLARGGSLAVAESCTGGWVSKVLTDAAGSSAWFEGGFITYSNAMKQSMLGVAEATLAEFGAVSEPTVAAMAAGVLSHSQAQFSLAISGIAGPGGGSAEKPVGMVCLAWDDGRGHARQETRYFDGNRDAVRRKAVLQALKGLLTMLGQDDSRKRLFFALWPDDEARDALGEAADSWGLPDGIRRHPAANLHVTLEFVGACDAKTQAAMEAAADTVAGRTFYIRVVGSGWFEKPRVAWLGVFSADMALQALRHQLCEALKDCGYEADEKPYKPHITVARKLRHPPTQHTYQAINWAVTRFALVESRSGEHGVEYVPLRFWDLTLT